MSNAKKSLKTTQRDKFKEGQAETDALFLSIGEGAMVIDSQGRISRVNQMALDILGFTRKELVGEWYPERVVAENEAGQVLPNLRRPITQSFLTGKAVSKRLYYRRKDGTRVAVALNVAPVLLGGKPVGAIEVFRDITRELVLEQAKDDFISVASHQLRTPATAVKQYVAMLLEGYAGKLTNRQIDLLRRSYQSNERQLSIIEDLLQVARVDAGKTNLNINSIDLVKLLTEVINEQSRKAAERHLVISMTASTHEVIVNIDPDRMRMVFENLLDNALKYSPPNKQVKVSIKRTGQTAVVKIRDEGVGIAQSDIGKLFRKFSRIHNPLSIEAGGTGLGLYWAERIVKLHKGRIDIKSLPGKGSTFSVYLPLPVKNHTEKN